MGLGAAPDPKCWESLQFMASHSLCFSWKPNNVGFSSSWRKRCGSNYTVSYGWVCRSSLCGLGSLRSHGIKRACSANFDEFYDEEIYKLVEGSAEKFDLSDKDFGGHHDDETKKKIYCAVSGGGEYRGGTNILDDRSFPKKFSTVRLDLLEPSFLGIQPELPDWPERDDVVRASIERKANCVELPLSLRIIKRKYQQQEGFKVAGEFTHCSVKKAFSSMVFIIQELQNYALHMRENLYYEDLQCVMAKLQREMNASFSWLFQQVFWRSPTLMVYLMVLLANFTVFSMTDKTVMAVTPSSMIMDVLSVDENKDKQNKKTDTPANFNNDNTLAGVNKFSDNEGKVDPTKRGSECWDKNLAGASLRIQFPNPVPDDISSVSLYGDKLTTEEEMKLWHSMVEEASRLEELRTVALDSEMKQRFVSPVTVQLEADDYEDYFKTDLLYQMKLSQKPNDPLLLSNYAQFLYLVAHDHDRAEECFKCAIQLEPPDAEALSHYADFLWMVRKDLKEAEERYQEAVAADPGNSHHTSKYANFLWNTGGEETCYPLNIPTYDNYNSKFL